jgi:hypothetical protein
MVMSLKSGEQHQVEDDAEKRLAAARRASVPDIGEAVYYLSREQELLRQSKEVLNVHGVPDGRLFRGMYHRKHNPLANDRPSGARHDD